jgi:hypothetical protein
MFLKCKQKLFTNILKHRVKMKLTIKWSPSEIKSQKLTFEQFKELCRVQYKSYYAKVSDEIIKAEYEFITGTKVKTTKTEK